MGEQAALDMLESAWSDRRRAFDLPDDEQGPALAAVREELERVAGMLRGTERTDHFAHALHLSAHLAMDLGDLAAAEEGWRQAVEVLRSTGEPLQLAHKIRHLGDLEMARGNLDEAARHYSEALALHREHSDQHSLDYANVVRRVAIIAERRAEAAEARARWAEARELYAALGVAEGVSEAEGRIEALGG